MLSSERLREIRDLIGEVRGVLIRSSKSQLSERVEMYEQIDRCIGAENDLDDEAEMRATPPANPAR